MMFRREYGKVNVASLVERVSRYAVVMCSEARQSKPKMEGLIQGLAALPGDARQSINCDRGTEYSAWRHLKAGIGADAWFCDPQALNQKGTVENTNNRVRKYLPRSTKPSPLSLRPMAHQMATDEKSIFEVDLPPLQFHAVQVPRLPDTCRGLADQAIGNPKPIGTKRHIRNSAPT